MPPNLGSSSEFARKVASEVRAALEGKRKVLPQEPFTEAWLGLALFYGESRLRLEEIIHIADGINHVYPKTDEIAWAFWRLKKRGWLVVEGELYGLTSEGRRAIGVVTGKGSGLKRVNRLKEWVSANPPSSDGGD